MCRTRCLGCAVVASIVLSGALQGDVLVTDSEFAFNFVAESQNLQLFEESLDDYSGFASSFSGGSGDWAWELSSSEGVFAGDSSIRAGAGQTALELTFASDQVYAIGGEFQLLDQEGAPMNGLIQLLLSDGTSYISTVGSVQAFAGFISDDVNITSLSVIGFGAYAPDVTSVSSFTIGVIPAPGALTLLGVGFGIGGSGLRRRRG